MIFRELNNMAQADWFILHMQPTSLLPCIFMASYHPLEILAARRVSLKPSTFPSSTCIDLLWVILYSSCAAAVCLKFSRHCIAVCTGCSKFLFLLTAAAINDNYSNNQQQQLRSRSIPPRSNTLTLSFPSPC